MSFAKQRCKQTVSASYAERAGSNFTDFWDAPDPETVKNTPIHQRDCLGL